MLRTPPLPQCRGGAVLVIPISRIASWRSEALERPVEHARPKLHDRHDIEQQHQGSEGERDRNRARATAALLLFREYDAGLGRGISHAGHPMPPSSASPPVCSTSSVANSTNRYKTEKANNRFAVCSPAAAGCPRNCIAS